MTNKNKISLPININFEEVSTQPDLQKCSIRVCKEGLVPTHGLYLDQEAIEDAQDTIMNKPLLCSYVIDSKGNKVEFKGHDIEYKKENGQWKRVFIEQPIGVVPESCNKRYDEESYFCVDAYIFKKYCEEVVDIIQADGGEKDVSMEIEILEDYEDENKVTHIKKFRFTGVTFLDGYAHQASIDGCNVQLFEKDNQLQLEFEKLVERVNKLEKEKEELMLDKNRQAIIDKFANLKGNVNFEKLVANEELTIEELEKELFSLSTNDLRERLREEFEEITYSYTDCWGDTYDRKKYWITDILFSENIVIVEDSEDYKNYGFSYTLEGDQAIIDFESKQRYVRGDWRVYEEGTPIAENGLFEDLQSRIKEKVATNKEAFEKVSKELEEAKVNYVNLEAEKTELEGQVAEFEKTNQELSDKVAEFEAKEAEAQEAARKADIDDTIKEFEKYSKIEGYTELFEKRYEFSKEDLVTKFKVFAYDHAGEIKETVAPKQANFEKGGSIKLGGETYDNAELTEAQKRYGVDIKEFESVY